MPLYAIYLQIFTSTAIIASNTIKKILLNFSHLLESALKIYTKKKKIYYKSLNRKQFNYKFCIFYDLHGNSHPSVFNYTTKINRICNLLTFILQHEYHQHFSSR